MNPPDANPDPTSMQVRTRVSYPSWSWVRARPARLLAFGLGSGLLRPASGTWGTLLAWLSWFVFAPLAPTGRWAWA